jgi:hypothetical protein
MKRYYIESGEAVPTSTDEREWNVYDRSTPCSDRDCQGCPGTVVFVATTRKAARAEAARLNA